MTRSILSELSALSHRPPVRKDDSQVMNENTPPDTGTTEPTPEPTVDQPTAVIEPTTSATPGWARDKFKRNTVVGGAAVAGAVIALAGAALVGDDDPKGFRGDFHAGPPAMQGGGQWRGPQGQGPGQGHGQGQGGQFHGEPGGPGAPDTQGQSGGSQDQQSQPNQSGKSDSQ